MRLLCRSPLLLLLLLDGVLAGKAKAGPDHEEHIVRLQKQAKQGSSAGKPFDFKAESFCKRAKRVITQKDLALRKLHDVIHTIQLDSKLPAVEKEFQVRRFMAFAQEVNETSQMILHSFDWLSDVLHGDYKDIINMRESSLERLSALRDAALREEQEYNAIITAEVSHQGPLLLRKLTWN